MSAVEAAALNVRKAEAALDRARIVAGALRDAAIEAERKTYGLHEALHQARLALDAAVSALEIGE